MASRVKMFPNTMIHSEATAMSAWSGPKENLPSAAATSRNPAGPPSTPASTTPTHHRAPPTSTTACSTSVHTTASMPPATVYTVHSTPMVRMHRRWSSPVTAARASAGRYSTTAIRPSCMKLYAAEPNIRTGRLNRASRYSYALVTFNRRNSGMYTAATTGTTRNQVSTPAK